MLLEVERQCIHQKHRSSRTEVSRVQGISAIHVRFWLPPKLAPIQAVIVPIWRGDDERAKILERVDQLTADWKGHFSFKIDDRENYRPGWKFNEWEQRGIPARIEIGIGMTPHHIFTL